MHLPDTYGHKIDPETTPRGISLEEIRAITRRDGTTTRTFEVTSIAGLLRVIAKPTVYFSDTFGDSRYFAEMVPRFAQGRFLEIGTGTGVVAIAVALVSDTYFRGDAEPFVATDINPCAVENARENAALNGVGGRIRFLPGNVFEPLGQDERFDCVFWNHPFHRGEKTEDIVQKACFDPGYHALEMYVRDGVRFLNDAGTLLLGSGNFADLNALRQIAARYGHELHLLHYVHRPFEAMAGALKTFNIYEIK